MMISYVDKIVRHAPQPGPGEGRVPGRAQKPFQGMEVNGNPWNLARIDRGNWAEGLGIPTMAELPNAPVLYWVGCAASYDDRAKKIARSTAKLMKAAGVEFAILGQEETCTGDSARRAGNEYLFAQLAEQNSATLNGYKEQGGIEADRHHLPALLQHPEERVPRLRRQVRGRAPHRLPPRPASPRRSSCRARSRGQGRLPRLLLPRPLQRHLRVAARHPQEHPRPRARRGRGMEQAEGPLLRRRRRRRCAWRSRTRTA